jgi:nucleotidyltransferase/DNA polymerase involved in DNA repair
LDRNSKPCPGKLFTDEEAYLDVTENKTGLATATKAASSIRQQIREELNLTASACVAPNKFLAKMPPIGAIRMVCS